MESGTKQIVLAGSGGQGIGLGGKILAEAALRQGLNATQSQSYGAFARGGSSRSEVIISNGDITYPLVERPDLLLALNPVAWREYEYSLAPHGAVIYDSETVPLDPAPGRHGYPLARAAREQNFAKGVTMMALGVAIGLTGLLKPEHVECAIRRNFPRESEQKENTRLFHLGLSMAGARAS